MKTNQAEAVARLKTLYAKKGENQIFARMLTPLPAALNERLERRASHILPEEFPSM